MSIHILGYDHECVPAVITQGERVDWTKSFGDYPADEYDLQYRFRGPGTGLDVDATADDSRFEIEMTAADPAFNVPGVYNWQAWLTEIADATNTFIIEQGTIEVKKGYTEGELGDLDEVDLRSPAQITLDSIDAALLAFATSDLIETEITTPAGSRRYKRSDKANLLSMRKEYAIRVSMERTRDRLRNGGSLMRSVPIVMRGS